MNQEGNHDMVWYILYLNKQRRLFKNQTIRGECLLTDGMENYKVKM